MRGIKHYSRLDSSDIIIMKRKIGLIALVEGSHQGFPVFWVTQAERVAEFMCRNLEQVYTYRK